MAEEMTPSVPWGLDPMLDAPVRILVGQALQLKLWTEHDGENVPSVHSQAQAPQLQLWRLGTHAVLRIAIMGYIVNYNDRARVRIYHGMPPRATGHVYQRACQANTVAATLTRFHHRAAAVDDGTGVLPCVTFRRNDQDDRPQFHLPVGQLVLARGRLNVFDDVKQMVLDGIHAEEDCNEEWQFWQETEEAHRAVYSQPINPAVPAAPLHPRPGPSFEPLIRAPMRPQLAKLVSPRAAQAQQQQQSKLRERILAFAQTRPGTFFTPAEARAALDRPITATIFDVQRICDELAHKGQFQAQLPLSDNGPLHDATRRAHTHAR
ncbi:uncharacterized protein MONBRDRAFT_38793 [Monosiga brevicollis MX1]|uniref:CST complex subunit STN1 n=1 Tax=Monosiga brevicollis TaxID=81824 RepID=A9VA62_MONBE|nr:uncharacterized protein MONBRDRAFT_38793 [Monosiga brevicollis MX1]EDQ85610.1 predicted protein [Monosiga brevicollis MX1]|eukprot:XP_001749559.1 hypothetical protein [Monosiga brevicollis MX1]